MDEKPDQIVEHIEHQRNALGRNLDELQHRIKSTADWRVQFDRHPMAMVGLAVGGGLLLGALVSSRSGNSGHWRRSSGIRGGQAAAGGYTASSLLSSASSASSPEGAGTQYQRSRAMETLDTLKGALMGYFSAMAKDWMNELLPGFNQHYEETSRRNQSQSQRSGFGTQHRSSESSYSSPQSPGSPSHSGSYSPTQAHGSEWQRQPTPAL
jgi:hypothetical protein